MAENKSVAIYRRGLSPYTVIFLCDGERATARKYTKRSALVADIVDHMQCGKTSHGEVYNGEFHGLLAVISKSIGGISFQYNTASNPDGVKQLFAELDVSKLIGVTEDA